MTSYEWEFFNDGNKAVQMTPQSPEKRNFSPRLMLHDIQALKGRSRVIGRLKYSLPGIALLGLLVLISWPHVHKWAYTQKSTMAQTAVQAQTNNTATNPEYKNSDDKNQPYTISADHGRETSPEIIDLTNPKMVMSLTTGEVVTLTAATGRLNKVTNKMHLVGKVTLTHSQGYSLETTQAWIDCNKGSAYGNNSISGNGPTGAISAEGFRLAERGSKVSFIGGTQLLLTSGGGK